MKVSVVPPPNWISGPTVTGNARIAFNSPKGSPRGECTVIAVKLSGISLSQEQIYQNTVELASAKEIEVSLTNYNNVKVLKVGRGILSGYPAQVFISEFSVGTPDGEQWGIMTSTTAVIAPNVSWSVGCGGLGRNISDARKSHFYWQMEFNNFTTNFKLK